MSRIVTKLFAVVWNTRNLVDQWFWSVAHMRASSSAAWLVNIQPSMLLPSWEIRWRIWSTCTSPRTFRIGHWHRQWTNRLIMKLEGIVALIQLWSATLPNDHPFVWSIKSKRRSCYNWERKTSAFRSVLAFDIMNVWKLEKYPRNSTFTIATTDWVKYPAQATASWIPSFSSMNICTLRQKQFDPTRLISSFYTYLWINDSKCIANPIRGDSPEKRSNMDIAMTASGSSKNGNSGNNDILSRIKKRRWLSRPYGITAVFIWKVWDSKETCDARMIWFDNHSILRHTAFTGFHGKMSRHPRVVEKLVFEFDPQLSWTEISIESSTFPNSNRSWYFAPSLRYGQDVSHWMLSVRYVR